tara:strand:- start:488 stop:2209 length:1722 start_codon:yes stop_codon:yes gene_type:complete
MEIYNKLKTPASEEFEKLLNSKFSKTQIEEGKIIEGKINKITEKYVFLHCEGLKSEPVLDINELKSMGLGEKIKLGEKIPVLLEKIEHPKTGEIVVSASKAQKIKGWDSIVSHYEKNEPINGKIINRVKGGFIVEHVETGSLAFLPGSQVDTSPVKDISKLMNVPQKFAIIKLDKVRGNACVSRREIISSFKKEDKAKIISKYKIGQIIKGAECKGFSSFGAFFNVNGEIDVLTHLQELSWSRIDHPDQIVEIGQKMDLKVISIDEDKLQIGCSIKQLTPDPFENVDKYEIDKDYDIKIVKIADFGAFGELEAGLICLLHNSELGFKKSLSAKKMFKVGDIVKVRLIDIDQDKRRIAVSHKLTLENPYQAFADKYPVGTICEGVVVNKNEYALFLKIKDTEIDTFCHCNDLTFLNDTEEELNKYKKGDTLQVKVMEVKVSEQRVRVSHKSTLSDPFDFFKDKSEKQIITAKIIKTDNKGLIVKPEGCEMDFHIKKSNIALNVADQRQSRFTNGDRIDVGIQSLQFTERKVILSIKLVEEMAKKEALEKYGQTDSGKQLPFKSLKEDLKKKEKN